MSPGEQVRDFMKVETAAEAIAAVAMARRSPRILNICSGQPTTVRSLVETWRADVNADIELNLGAVGYPSYEPFAFWGDNGRLSELLAQAGAGPGRGVIRPNRRNVTRASESRPAKP